MNKTIKRLSEVSIFAIILFVCLSIIYRFFLHDDEWVFKSLGWALPYSTALFLKSYMSYTRHISRMVSIALISFVIMVFTLFVSWGGLSSSDPWSHAIYVAFAFIWGSLFPKTNKCKDDEKNENKTEPCKEDEPIVV